MAMADFWQLVEISGEIAVYAYGNASNFKMGSQDVSKEILSNLVKKMLSNLVLSFSISSMQLGKSVRGH